MIYRIYLVLIHDSKGLYNVKDINVGKGLITTIFNNVYFDVTNQNFFIITTKGYEIHLAHYNPLDKYNTDKEKKADVSKNSNITYMSSEGKVWGVPTGVKHAIEGTSFTYPKYQNWLTNGSETRFNEVTCNFIEACL